MWNPDFSSLHGMPNENQLEYWVYWGQGNNFWFELSRVTTRDPSNRDSTEVKIIKAFTRFTFTVSIFIISCFTSFSKE